MESDSRYYFGGYIQLHDGRYWCRICGIWLGNYDNARIHCATTNAHSWCEPCERVFISEKSLENHQLNSGLHNICWLCDPAQDFDTEEDLEIHEEEAHFCCDLCDDFFKTEHELKEHKNDKHWSCQTCGEWFTSESGRDLDPMAHETGSAKSAIEISDAFPIGLPIWNSDLVDQEIALEELLTKSMVITNSVIETATGSVVPANDTSITYPVSFPTLKTAMATAVIFLTMANSCQP
ncbi:uncharacterized protein N7483_012257 [Penicillium malachiteum]|uniref:uncharacterized protein n=1 Tax=Penicillium malachiteum TaxID=1324776 RepID=UPI0025493BEF|nr:uncharacterized protein N7483_012257 [Penicillium malachiteum]KAJ5715076.1 hypothetical protein N7483_012257 [Penicillium malachiteum]